MSETFFITTSKQAYIFVRDMLKELKDEPQTHQQAEMILQKSWKKVLTTYPNLIDNESLIRSLLYTTAKKESIAWMSKYTL